MPKIFVFADEAGCFTFNRNQNVSRYFVICTVSMRNCDVGVALLDLRQKLIWDGFELDDCFHATTDKQAVRDRVFETILSHPFSVQATIMEKSKAHEHVRATRHGFYKTGYFHHFKNGVSVLIDPESEALLTTASLGTKKERATFQKAVTDVMRQTQNSDKWKADFMPCQAHPCLQVADYCAWAIQRKWERSDFRSYDLFKDRITYERDIWAHGVVHYY